MITLISSKKLGVYKIMRNTVMPNFIQPGIHKIQKDVVLFGIEKQWVLNIANYVLIKAENKN